jgi:peptide/nickel transport system permease protein
MVALSSTPTFLLAILMILLFYSRLGLLPASGRLTNDQTTDGPTGLLTLDALLHLDFPEFGDAVQHLVIPALCLAVGPAVAIARVLRSSLIDVLNQDYVRTAQAKGLSNWAVLRRHGLRNAVGPALSMAGLQVGLLLTGVVVVELVLAWPGLGLYTTQAITSADFPAVTGVVLVLGLAYVVINALVDVLQMIADPRLRTGANS